MSAGQGGDRGTICGLMLSALGEGGFVILSSLFNVIKHIFELQNSSVQLLQ